MSILLFLNQVVLKIANETDLINLKKNLDENNVKYHCWIEQPENQISSLATYPTNQDDVSKYFKHLKLYK